jgi:peroxiredoxin
MHAGGRRPLTENWVGSIHLTGYCQENVYMSRQFISGVITLASLALCSVVLGQATESARKPQAAQEPSGVQRQSSPAELQMQKLQSQIDDLRTGHQALIDQLTALRTIAVKEKAAGTVKAIETIISKQQATYQANLRRLQSEQQTIRQTLRDSTGGADRASRQPRKAPEFELKTFDGKTVKLSDYTGKIVVLEWIDLDCPFSMYHHKTKSTMVDLANKYKNKNVVWLAINSTGTTKPEANVSFAKEQKLPYPILDDRTGRVGRLYGVQKTPQMFIIDPQRTLVYEGAIDNAPMGKIAEGSRLVNYVDQALAALTSGKGVPTPMTLPYGTPVKYAAP